MAIWKKSISTVMSAALLASLLAGAIAPAALAGISQTSAGNVAQGTTSAGTATYLFTENSATALNVTGTMTVTITPAAPIVGTVEWAGTPVVSAPGSLGATASIAGNVLTVKTIGFDNANVETIAISGLKVKASATATPGAVVATISAGMIADAFRAGTATATGKLAQAYGIGTTSFAVANDAGSCFFSGTNNVTVGGEVLTGITVSAVNTPVPGQQTITSAASTASHLANDVVTQTVPNCTPTSIASPATVVRAAAFSYTSTPTVFPGESNGVAGNLTVTEPAFGFFPVNSTLTFTIGTAGVVFSQVPTAADNNGVMTTSAAVLSADRKSVVVTVTAASTVDPAVITLSNIRYDVAATVPGGTFVEVTLAPSGALIVTGNPATNAIVFRGITATASTPTVYIGENNQATGLVTLTELSAGIFNSGTGANNVIAVCQAGVAYSYTFAPWAKVTVGDLRLREGAVASPDNIVAGAYDSVTQCYTWTVWSGSTVASTIQIGNDTFTTGPLISVSVNQAPGIVAMRVFSGNSLNYDDTLIASVGFANAAFKNQVAVTALSQPTIPAGAVTKAGAIQIMETANGQLKANERICFQVLARGSAAAVQAKYDTLISALNTAQLPLVTASGGLVVSPVQVSNEGCDRVNLVPAGQVVSFAFTVLQQSTNGTGKLVADNINLITLADAASGPVLFQVWGLGGSPTVVQFQSQVSNAKIGVKPAIAINATSALGLMPNQGAWSTATKVAAANKYITWRFQGGSALAGKTVDIYVAAKNSNGGWGPFVKLTSRLANASGTAYFQWRSTGQWLSVRAMFPGDNSFAESWSAARQGRWK